MKLSGGRGADARLLKRPEDVPLNQVHPIKQVNL
jgi:hypothetical protein